MLSKILYIEDDSQQLELVRMFLSRDEFHFLSARDGIEGLDVAQRELPLLALVDINLPIMNGIEFAQHMRARATTAHIPLIALTSNTQHGILHGHIGTLFDAYLAKPVLRKDLLSCIRQFVAQPS